MANSVDPDLLQKPTDVDPDLLQKPSGATLFAKEGYIQAQQDKG